MYWEIAKLLWMCLSPLITIPLAIGLMQTAGTGQGWRGAVRAARDVFLVFPTGFFVKAFYNRFIDRRNAHSQDGYLVGYRYAYLSAQSNSKFLPIRGGNRSFDTESVARCSKGRCNKSPGNYCECGFYGMKRPWLLPFGNTSGTNHLSRCLLKVDFSGTVIEAELGFRAQKQRVLSCKLNGHCAKCRRWRRKTAGVILEHIAIEDQRDRLWSHAALIPACKKHLASGKRPIPLSELASYLGTEVTVG